MSNVSSEFVQHTSVDSVTLPNELHSAECSDWTVESLGDDLNRSEIQNEYSDNSDDWPVEYLEFTALEI